MFFGVFRFVSKKVSFYPISRSLSPPLVIYLLMPLDIHVSSVHYKFNLLSYGDVKGVLIVRDNSFICRHATGTPNHRQTTCGQKWPYKCLSWAHIGSATDWKTPILAAVNGLMYAKLLIVFVKLVYIYMINKMNTYSCVVERQSLYVWLWISSEELKLLNSPPMMT